MSVSCLPKNMTVLNSAKDNTSHILNNLCWKYREISSFESNAKSWELGNTGKEKRIKRKKQIRY